MGELRVVGPVLLVLTCPLSGREITYLCNLAFLETLLDMFVKVFVVMVS